MPGTRPAALRPLDRRQQAHHVGDGGVPAEEDVLVAFRERVQAPVGGTGHRSLGGLGAPGGQAVGAGVHGGVQRVVVVADLDSRGIP